MPVYGTSVTVNSTSQKLLAKLQRKDAKRVRVHATPCTANCNTHALQGCAMSVLPHYTRLVPRLDTFG